MRCGAFGIGIFFGDGFDGLAVGVARALRRDGHVGYVLDPSRFARSSGEREVAIGQRHGILSRAEGVQPAVDRAQARFVQGNALGALDRQTTRVLAFVRFDRVAQCGITLYGGVSAAGRGEPGQFFPVENAAQEIPAMVVAGERAAVPSVSQGVDEGFCLL